MKWQGEDLGLVLRGQFAIGRSSCGSGEGTSAGGDQRGDGNEAMDVDDDDGDNDEDGEDDDDE